MGESPKHAEDKFFMVKMFISFLETLQNIEVMLFGAVFEETK